MSGTPPTALVGHSSTLVGIELFVFGGSDGKRDGNEVRNASIPSATAPPHSLRPATQRLTRAAAAASALGLQVYIFDTETYAWSMPSLEGTAPVARVGHSGTLVGSTKVCPM